MGTSSCRWRMATQCQQDSDSGIRIRSTQLRLVVSRWAPTDPIPPRASSLRSRSAIHATRGRSSMPRRCSMACRSASAILTTVWIRSVEHRCLSTHATKRVCRTTTRPGRSATIASSGKAEGTVFASTSLPWPKRVIDDQDFSVCKLVLPNLGNACEERAKTRMAPSCSRTSIPETAWSGRAKTSFRSASAARVSAGRSTRRPSRCSTWPLGSASMQE
mmetsp:Transcript_29935/g.75415  ORF Transcript_29935/g.75415 Transcript_29935/m.75415 type:complete len:218 (-) Transcript_29935:284-937(-)